LGNDDQKVQQSSTRFLTPYERNLCVAQISKGQHRFFAVDAKHGQCLPSCLPPRLSLGRGIAALVGALRGIEAAQGDPQRLGALQKKLFNGSIL